jgi:hypothetical protein
MNLIPRINTDVTCLDCGAHHPDHNWSSYCPSCRADFIARMEIKLQEHHAPGTLGAIINEYETLAKLGRPLTWAEFNPDATLADKIDAECERIYRMIGYKESDGDVWLGPALDRIRKLARN